MRRLRSDDWFRAGIETALDQISDRLAEKRRDSTVVSIAHAEIFRDPVPKLKRIDVQARRAWIVEMEEYIRARRSFYTERGSLTRKISTCSSASTIESATPYNLEEKLRISKEIVSRLVGRVYEDSRIRGIRRDIPAPPLLMA